MSLLGDIANLVFLAAALIAGILALVFHNRYAKVADRIGALEAEVSDQQTRTRSLTTDLERSRKEVERLTQLAASAGVDRSRLEPARPEGAPGKPDKKKGDRPADARRLRELEQQSDDLRRQLELAQKQLKTRDSDVRHLKEELETLQVALAEYTRPAHRPGPFVDEEEASLEPVAPAAPTPAPAPAAPAIDPEVLEARLTEARQLAEAAERIRHEAIGRANLAELETRRTKERLERLDKRSHELLERLLASEREQRKMQREVESYRRMYMGLKGRFDVARDTLYSFQERFGVTIPTEVGVPLLSDMADFVELEEEEERNRPRRGSRPRREERDRSSREESAPPAAGDSLETMERPGATRESTSDATAHPADENSSGEKAPPAENAPV